MAGARKRKAPEDSSSESDTEDAHEDLIYDAMREGESFGVVWRHFRRGCTRSDRVEAYRVIKEVVEADDVQAASPQPLTRQQIKSQRPRSAKPRRAAW